MHRPGAGRVSGMLEPGHAIRTAEGDDDVEVAVAVDVVRACRFGPGNVRAHRSDRPCVAAGVSPILKPDDPSVSLVRHDDVERSIGIDARQLHRTGRSKSVPGGDGETLPARSGRGPATILVPED